MRNGQVRARLDRRLAVWRDLPTASTTRPAAGWVRAVRDALGMSAADLAHRLGVSPAAVSKLEASERDDRIRLDTLRRAAAALDCDVVYALVPRRSLEDTVRRRADVVVSRELPSIETTMSLEGQALEADDAHEAREELVRRTTEDRWLWKD